MKPPELGYRLRSALAGYVSSIRTRPFARVELEPYSGPHDESWVKPWQDSRGHLHYIRYQHQAFAEPSLLVVNPSSG